jgi:hypothetical protein
MKKILIIGGNSSIGLSQIVFDLCQDHWSHLNGACIDLNGGEHVR